MSNLPRGLGHRGATLLSMGLRPSCAQPVHGFVALASKCGWNDGMFGMQSVDVTARLIPSASRSLRSSEMPLSSWRVTAHAPTSKRWFRVRFMIGSCEMDRMCGVSCLMFRAAMRAVIMFMFTLKLTTLKLYTIVISKIPSAFTSFVKGSGSHAARHRRRTGFFYTHFYVI